MKELRLPVVRPPDLLDIGVDADAEHVVVRGHAPVVAELAAGSFSRRDRPGEGAHSFRQADEGVGCSFMAGALLLVPPGPEGARS